MDCIDFQSIIAGERDEDLSPAEALAFERHLETCASCADAVALAEGDLDRLASVLEPPAIPVSAWASVDAAVSSAIRGSEKKPAPRGEITPLALPIAVNPAHAPAATTLVPAHVPAQPLSPSVVRRLDRSVGASLVRRLGNGPVSGLSIAAAVILGALLLSFVSVSGSRERAVVGIGRVAAPEDRDVVIVKSEPGENYRQMEGSSRTTGFISIK